MKKSTNLVADGRTIRLMVIGGEDYICLTDIARFKNPDFPADVVRNWMRSKTTVAYLGLWEQLHNPAFNMVEFDQFRNEAGTHAFVLPPQTWIERTGATGLVSKSGRYGGGTFAHHDIAFEFASWVSVEFKLYLITDYQRLKSKEQARLGWSAKRELSKINYRIHTDAIRQNLVPAAVSREQLNVIYASEADVLNVALFGLTHRQWQEQNPGLPGNQRDHATVNQLICLSNLENVNAVLIHDGLPQSLRLQKLNEIAIRQMRILAETGHRRLLRDPTPAPPPP